MNRIALHLGLTESIADYLNNHQGGFKEVIKTNLEKVFEQAEEDTLNNCALLVEWLKHIDNRSPADTLNTVNKLLNAGVTIICIKGNQTFMKETVSELSHYMRLVMECEQRFTPAPVLIP